MASLSLSFPRQKPSTLHRFLMTLYLQRSLSSWFQLLSSYSYACPLPPSYSKWQGDSIVLSKISSWTSTTASNRTLQDLACLFIICTSQLPFQNANLILWLKSLLWVPMLVDFKLKSLPWTMRLRQVCALPVILLPSQDHGHNGLLSNPEASTLFSAIGPLYTVLPCLEWACTHAHKHT